MTDYIKLLDLVFIASLAKATKMFSLSDVETEFLRQVTVGGNVFNEILGEGAVENNHENRLGTLVCQFSMKSFEDVRNEIKIFIDIDTC